MCPDCPTSPGVIHRCFLAAHLVLYTGAPPHKCFTLRDPTLLLGSPWIEVAHFFACQSAEPLSVRFTARTPAPITSGPEISQFYPPLLPHKCFTLRDPTLLLGSPWIEVAHFFACQSAEPLSVRLLPHKCLHFVIRHFCLDHLIFEVAHFFACQSAEPLSVCFTSRTPAPITSGPEIA